MSQKTTPTPGRGLADPPSAVEISILADPHARPFRERLAHLRGRVVPRSRVIAGVLVVMAATGVLVAGALVVGHGGARHGSPARSGAHGSRGVDAAYGVQPRCLAVLRARPGYVHADLTAVVRANRSSPCARWGGTAAAIFHDSRGVSQPATEAIEHPCAMRSSLRRAVQEQLGVCP